MKSFLGIIGVSLIVVLGIAAPAAAINDTAANARALFLGQAHFQTMTSGANYWYKVNLEAGRSYAVYAWSPYAEVSNNLSLGFSLYRSDGTTTATTVYGSDIEPSVKYPIAEGSNGDQKRIIPSVTDSYRIELHNNSANAVSIYVMVVETTLFSPWYYVYPTEGYDAFVEIRNNTTSSLTVVVTAHDSGGVPLSRSVILPANGNSVITVSSLGVVSGFGSVQISHSGGPGAICANTTTLSPITGLSFDAPFTPRMTWSNFVSF